MKNKELISKPGNNLESNVYPTKTGETYLKTNLSILEVAEMNTHFNSIVIELCKSDLSDEARQGVSFFAKFLKGVQLTKVQYIRGVIGID